MNSPQAGGQMYMKMLMVVDGKSGSVSRMIMQMAGQPPMEMPMQGMMGNMQQNTSTDIRDTAERVGTESVTTPAGTFSTEHYRAKDGSWDAWLSLAGRPVGPGEVAGARHHHDRHQADYRRQGPHHRHAAAIRPDANDARDGPRPVEIGTAPSAEHFSRYFAELASVSTRSGERHT